MDKKYCDAECKDGHPCDRIIDIGQEGCHQHSTTNNQKIEEVPLDLYDDTYTDQSIPFARLSDADKKLRTIEGNERYKNRKK